MSIPHLTVEAYAGYKGEETPRALIIDGIRLCVVNIVDRWYSESHSYFRIHASDGHRYVLRYHLDGEFWELVMQERCV
ncbi:MAG TPA: hypothetical protein VIR79_07355 [Nitrospira sp.]